MVNENGGKMPDAVGIPEEQLRQAARGAVCKINIDSDLRLAMTGTIRKYLQRASRRFRSPSVSEARPRRHQGAGQAQDHRRAGLRPQDLTFFIPLHYNIIGGISTWKRKDFCPV